MGRHERARKQIPQTAGRRAVAGPSLRNVSVDRRTAAYAAAVFLAVFALYAATAARDLIIGDTAEFVTVAATFGVAHPSGYPLLILLGHLSSLIPVGPLPFRMDLLSVVSGAGTATFVFLIARQFGAGAIASTIAAFTLASHPLFWEWSLVIEAFPLNNLIVAAVLYFLFRWEGQPSSRRDLVIAALLSGLGASNHLTIVFVIPAILSVLWRRRAHVFGDPRLVATCLGATAIGFLPYATIPWAASRHPFFNWGSISTSSDLLDHFLRRAYGTGNLAAPGESAGSPWLRVLLLARSFSYLQLVLLPLGAVAAYRRHRWYFWSTVLVFVLAGPMFAWYANIDATNGAAEWVLQRFHLMPLVVVAPLAAFGAVLLSDLVSRYVMRGGTRLAEAVVACGAAAAILGGTILTYPRVDQSRSHVARNYGVDILNSLPAHAVLLAWNDDVVLPVVYLQAVEHMRPDVTVVMQGILRGATGSWYISQLRQRDPNLVIPFNLYNRNQPTANIKALVDANPGRPFDLAGTQLDDSLEQTHYYYRRGLVRDILPMSVDVSIEAASAEYDRLMRIYHVPDSKTVKFQTFETRILRDYALAAEDIGDTYAAAHRNAEAAAWYRRALKVFPGLLAAQEALDRVSK